MLTFVFACVSLLSVPGPTNMLLFSSGLARGYRGAVTLYFAGLCGYLIAIAAWSLLYSVLVSSLALSIFIKAGCALYLMLLAVKMWKTTWQQQNAPDFINARVIFLTTVLNPKGFIFASSVFPHAWYADPTCYPFIIAPFCLTLLIAFAVWVSGGALLRRRVGRQIPSALPGRFSALALGAFALVMLLSGAKMIPAAFT